MHLRCREQWPARPEDVLRQSLARTLRLRRGVELVHEVGEAEFLAVGVVQCDVEVSSRHQLADDPVDRREQLLERLCRVGRLGDAEGRALDQLRPAALRDVADGADPEAPAAVREGATLDFDPQGGAVLPARGVLVALGGLRAMVLGDEVRVLGRDEIGHRPADHLFRGVAEHRGKGRVAGDDPALLGDADALERRFGEQAEALLALPGRLVQGAPRGDVPDDGLEVDRAVQRERVEGDLGVERLAAEAHVLPVETARPPR